MQRGKHKRSSADKRQDDPAEGRHQECLADTDMKIIAVIRQDQRAAKEQRENHAHEENLPVRITGGHINKKGKDHPGRQCAEQDTYNI